MASVPVYDPIVADEPLSEVWHGQEPVMAVALTDNNLGKADDVQPIGLYQTGPPVSGSAYGRQLIGQALYSRIASVNSDRCSPGDEDAFFVADMGEVYRHHRRWVSALPRITPFYAVKCNPDPGLVKLLANLGCGFDCASKSEIDQVLSLGLSPDRIVYAQPVKTKSFIRYAQSKDVALMTFDNADELFKIKAHFPAAQLLLRIATDDRGSLCQFSIKFGASLSSVPALLHQARQLDLDVAGVAFHVGSGASDPNAFVKAIADSKRVFDLARACGLNPRVLDVGGGFTHLTFDRMAVALSSAIDTYFPTDKNPGLRMIAEPGRYCAASAYVLATNVIARRAIKEGNQADTEPASESDGVDGWVKRQAERLAAGHLAGPDGNDDTDEDAKERFMLYVNDGVYGNFSNIMFDHQEPTPKVLTCRGQFLFDPAMSGQTRFVDLRQGIDDYDSAASVCPTPLTFASDSNSGTGFSSPVRTRSVDDLDAFAQSGSSQAGQEKKYKYSVWGPTCDSIDCISSMCELEHKVEVGDWLYFTDMGAYTRCSATGFNGFSNTHSVVYVCSEPAAYSYLAADRL